MTNSTDILQSKLNTKVLLREWAELSIYDHTASQLKAEYVQGRRRVILLTLISTVAAVATTVIGQQSLAILFAVISITLPIIAAFLMTDIIRFTGTNAWIKYRYTAEIMRMNIFLYRMQAGIYAAGPPEAMDDLLADTISALKNDVKPKESGIPPRVEAPTTEEAIKAAIADANKYTPDDDGLSEITADQYVQWRVIQQEAWYNNATNRDFAQLRNYTRAAQIILLVGAIISALAGTLNVEIVVLVAITNAISVALANAANVSMFGKTYSLFMVAAEQLSKLETRWDSYANNPEYLDPTTKGKVITDFVQQIENTLAWERREWYELALQMQNTTDKAILSDLTRLTQRAEEEQKKTV